MTSEQVYTAMSIGGSGPNGAGGLFAMLLGVGLAAGRGRRRSSFVIDRLVHRLRRLGVSKAGLTLAALLVGVLAPRAAAATQSAELYRTQAYFYGRFEARVQFAPGEGVVSSFFLWRDGSSSTTSWNELDFEKINSDCRLQTNIWTGKGNAERGDQHALVQYLQRLPHVRVRVDAGLHRLVDRRHADPEGDGRQRHRIHAERVPGHGDPLQHLGRATRASEETSTRRSCPCANTSAGPSTRRTRTARSRCSGAKSSTAAPRRAAGWSGNWTSPLNHSTHNPANVSFVNGIADPVHDGRQGDRLLRERLPRIRRVVPAERREPAARQEPAEQRELPEPREHPERPVAAACRGAAGRRAAPARRDAAGRRRRAAPARRDAAGSRRRAAPPRRAACREPRAPPGPTACREPQARLRRAALRQRAGHREVPEPPRPAAHQERAARPRQATRPGRPARQAPAARPATTRAAPALLEQARVRARPDRAVKPEATAGARATSAPRAAATRPPRFFSWRSRSAPAAGADHPEEPFHARHAQPASARRNVLTKGLASRQ